MKKYTFLCMLLIAGSNLFALPENFVKYSNPHHGFSVSFPADWKCESRIDKTFVLYLSNAEETKKYPDKYKTTVISISYPGTEVILSEQATYLKDFLQKSEGYHFIADGNTKLNGKDTYQISYSKIEKGKELYETQYIIIAGTKMILITRADMEILPLLTGVLHDIIYSFEDTEPYTPERRTNSNLLFKATWSSDFTEVKRLVDSGVNANDVNESGVNSIHNAAMQKNYDLFAYMIEKGADVNSRNPMTGVTPVFGVNWNGNSMGKINFYQLLVDKGADLNAKNYKGETAIQKLKAMYSKMEDVKFLKSKGAQ